MTACKFKFNVTRYESNKDIPLALIKPQRIIPESVRIYENITSERGNYNFSYDPYVYLPAISGTAGYAYQLRLDINDELSLPKQIERVPDKILLSHRFPYYYQYQLKHLCYAPTSNVVRDSIKIINENGVDITDTIDYEVEYTLNDATYKGVAIMTTANSIDTWSEEPYVFYDAMDLHPTSDCEILPYTDDPYVKMQDLSGVTAYDHIRTFRNGYGITYQGAAADGPIFTYTIGKSSMGDLSCEFFVFLENGWYTEMGSGSCLVAPTVSQTYFVAYDGIAPVIDDVALWRNVRSTGGAPPPLNYSGEIYLHFTVGGKSWLFYYEYDSCIECQSTDIDDYDGHHKITFYVSSDGATATAMLDNDVMSICSGYPTGAYTAFDLDTLVIDTNKAMTHHTIDDLLIYEANYADLDIHTYDCSWCMTFPNNRYNPSMRWFSFPPSSIDNLYRIRILLTEKDALTRELYVRYTKSFRLLGDEVWTQDSHIEAINPRPIYRETDITGIKYDYLLNPSTTNPILYIQDGNALYTYIETYKTIYGTEPNIYTVPNQEKTISVLLGKMNSNYEGLFLDVREGSFLQTNASNEFLEFRNNDYYNEQHVWDYPRDEVALPYRCKYYKFEEGDLLSDTSIMAYERNIRFRYIYETREYPYYYIAHTYDYIYDLDYDLNPYVKYVWPSNILDNYETLPQPVWKDGTSIWDHYPELSLGINVYINNTLINNSSITDINELAGKIFFNFPIANDAPIRISYATYRNYARCYSFNLHKAYPNGYINYNPITVAINPYFSGITALYPAYDLRNRLIWHTHDEFVEYDGINSIGKDAIIPYSSDDAPIIDNAVVVCDIFSRNANIDEIEDARRRGGGLRTDNFFDRSLQSINNDVFSYADVGTLYPFPYVGAGLIKISNALESIAKDSIATQNPTWSSDEINQEYINILTMAINDYNPYGTYWIAVNASGEYITSTINAIDVAKSEQNYG